MSTRRSPASSAKSILRSGCQVDTLEQIPLRAGAASTTVVWLRLMTVPSGRSGASSMLSKGASP